MYKQLENVKQFHETFGANVEDRPVIPSKERVKLRLALILEELTELAQASGVDALADFRNMLLDKIKGIELGTIPAHSQNGNIVECLDALVDLEYVSLGTVLEYGLHNIFNDAGDEVHDSNMSKLCKTEEEAKRTVVDRLKTRNEVCVYRYCENVDGYIVERKDDNKVIKSIDYRPANLDKFIIGS